MGIGEWNSGNIYIDCASYYTVIIVISLEAPHEAKFQLLQTRALSRSI